VVEAVKISLDECVDWRLACDIGGHDLETGRQMGWTAIKNGEFLTLGSEHFDVFIPTDRNPSFQQNLALFSIAVIVLKARINRLADLRAFVPSLMATIDPARPSTASFVVPHNLAY
jgi:hypothetical protein